MTKRYLDVNKLDYQELDIKYKGKVAFREFYGQNRDAIYRGQAGIEFPIFTDGSTIRQGIGVVVAYFEAGTCLDDFIGNSHLYKDWIGGLHISDGDPKIANEFVNVL